MLEHIKELQGLLKEKRKLLQSIKGLPEDCPDVPTTINNTELLLKELTKLYKDEKAKHLPHTISTTVKQSIVAVVPILNSFSESGEGQADNVSQVITEMDELYANCLKYGLITFGFTAKEKSQTIEELRLSVNALLSQIESIKNEALSAQDTLKDAGSKAEEEVERLLSQYNDSVSQKTESLEQQIDTAVNTFTDDCQQKKQHIQEYVDKAKSTSENLSELHKKGTEIQQNIEGLLNKATESTQSVAKTQEDAETVKSSIDEQLQQSQNLNQQIESSLQQANTNTAEVKAKNTNADELLALIKQKQKDVDEFHENLEEHRQDMAEIKKQAGVDYSKIKSSSESTVESCKEQTDAIVSENEQLQEQIKKLLTQAVGAGLFGVFEGRQKVLAKGRVFWQWAVVGSSVLVAVGILVVAWLLSEKPDVVFFVRLAVMVPLGFLMYFTAAQYRKERQAEEEYAFKSAISFSLEPYRDLLDRMREKGELETEFVKKLMDDIFDNPVGRIYRSREKDDEVGEGDVISKMVSLVEKLPKEKRKIIWEALRKGLFGQP